MKRVALIGCLSLLVTLVVVAWPESPGERLIKDLACGACHAGMPKPDDIHRKTPNLGHAGQRYTPAYLFDYLQNPTKVRRHTGASRMPGFYFRPEESLALVLFLQSQSITEGQWPVFPADGTKPIDLAVDASIAMKAKALMVDSLDCVKCHLLQGQGDDRSIDLTTVGYRLEPEWVRKYLVAPYIFDGPHTTMPSFFYSLNAARNRFDE